MTIKEYVEIVSKRLQSGISREHSYRGDLETLIRELVDGIEITNEPANVTDCGNPDYVITKGKIPVGYIEAKDIGKDLNSKSYKEQFGRYKKALDNLIITDYIWFQFFQNGELVHEIKIGEIENNSVKPIPENFSKFENLIKDFCTHVGQTIKSSKKLAEMMAGKSRLLQDILERAITSDEETQENTSIKGQYDTFKEILIHDLKPKGFADIYAQTLAYGMFAARLHDPTLDDFSRQEAAELIPKSNPFLRKLFGYIAGPDIDERIVTVVDNLAEVFRATNVEQLLKNFGKSTQTNDPIIHFYETFLAEYDPKLRKARGVWYTPEPVVNFIVRAVDDILKTEFDLPQGLADTSKTKIKLNTDITDKRSATGYKQIEKEVHKVQILDPATGTGTFLAEVVKFIYNKNFKAMKGAWSGYVEEHLIPRLNGFELLMASYSMAHLKLDMLLTETGYKSTKNERLNIYLTNSLEEHHKDTGTLFSNWLSSEANEANHIKRDTPVMCVIGNPPYAVSSTNKGDWIQGLLNDYKKDLNERKINLDDDYIKFLRYGQYYIEKNGEGILAYISNNSFIDGITHRQMRKNLLETFDKVYILDLHGNAKKKEICPDGSPDQNVFDIMQGVSINIFIKTGNKKSNQLGKVFHSDLFGKRDVKYPYLFDKTVSTIKWEVLKNKEPYFFFVPKDFESEEKYKKGFKVSELFLEKVPGIETIRDAITIHFEQEKLKETVNDFLELDEKEIAEKYNTKDARDWKIGRAKNDVIENINNPKVWQDIYYRPFDTRKTFYSGKQNGFVCNGRYNVMKHLLSKNFGLIVPRQTVQDYRHCFITNKIFEGNITASAKMFGTGNGFPLYLYPENNGQQTIEESISRKPNLNQEIVDQIAKKLGLTFTKEKEETKNTFAPIDILDYIYAVLYSPTYRDKYKEFLKIDFPRVPYPKDEKTFWSLVKLGKEVREIHLLESNKVENYITSYEMAEDAENDHNVITTKIGKKDWEIIDTEKQLGRIWINESKYFDNVPVTAWEFYIGGYQPAQKWLKDRKERELYYEDILHYQKIIVALTETDRIMKEIDKIEVE
ncbi:type ISP restriction/modification enzyme [Maribacter sp. ACAM166]|uniref:type ISP restriction/modification enzyme n=1 Tax=Maribacter sp. ACAM166 TaxID=2508996 RepID=UPI0010FDE41D|nr:type ISP restriction/modification enzyme [Maribacter sp. ACAM166]TLP75665.1 DNA methyltransferase [Maribacter sp. ACAM166]